MEQPITLPVETDEDQLPADQAQAILDLLRSWEDDDPEEQRETLAYLQAALDEDRLSNRKLFP